MSWISARAGVSHPSAPPIMRIVLSTSSNERWFVHSTATPLPIRSRMTSFWRSEKPSTRSGSSARILSSLNVVKPPTLAFSRASSGRRAVPGTPTTRSPAPSTCTISAVSVVRQTTRCGKSTAVLPYTRSGLVHLAPSDATLEREVLLARHRRLRADDLARAGGAVGEHVDGHRRQRLGRGEVRERLVHDLKVRTMAAPARAADIWMEDRHHLGEIAHVGGTRAMADLPVVLVAQQPRHRRLEAGGHRGVAAHRHVTRQRLDLDGGAERQRARPQGAVDLDVRVEDRLDRAATHVRFEPHLGRDHV